MGLGYDQCIICCNSVVSPMIYYEHWVFKYWPMKNYTGITLTSSVILFKPKKENVGQRLMNHEKAHELQYAMMDIPIIPGEIDGIAIFWGSYVFSYLWNLVKYRSHWKAYKMIWHERMARELSDV